jgi:hypothetical protein
VKNKSVMRGELNTRLECFMFFFFFSLSTGDGLAS